MLIVTSLGHSNADYLTSDPAYEVADLTGQAVSHWWGHGARGLGLSGEVTSPELRSLFLGEAPYGTLRLKARRSVVGWDAIFAAPKSASVLFSSSDRELAREALFAHEHSMDGVCAYLEDRVLQAQRRDQDGQSLALRGVVLARFTHGVSRSLDPHLHSHLVIPNFAQATDGRFGSLDSRSIQAHREVLDALYRSYLRNELTTRLGVRYASLRHGSDRICGTTRSQELLFSHRSTELREGRIDRDEKPIVHRNELERRWRKVEREARYFGPEPLQAADRFIDEHRFAAQLHGSAYRPRDVTAALCNAAATGLDRRVLDFLRSPWSNQRGGVAEAPLLRETVVPSAQSVRVLGPRPIDLDALERWTQSARVLEMRSHRDRDSHLGRTGFSIERDQR